MADLNLTVRWLRHATDEGVPCTECAIMRGTRDWRVPAEQSAFVLVDCWAEHFIESHQASSARIMRDVLRPVVDAAGVR